MSIKNGPQWKAPVALFGIAALCAAAYALAASGVFAQFYGQGFMLVQDAQRVFHDQMATDLQTIKETHSLLATGGLMLIGFLYGIFHAVGPGHGKVVVAGYMLASKSSLKRGLVITLLSSLLQAVSAILLVFGLFYLLGLARAQTENAAMILENASFGLIMLVGMGLMIRGAREAWDLYKGAQPKHTHHHHPDHAHEHHHHDHHHHEHDGACGCGHQHVPDAADVQKADSLGAQAFMIFSIGIRPCSGAILLLLFSCMLGVYTAGILATFAMAIGTAMTTGALAVAAVQAKKLTLKFMKSSSRGLAVAHAGLGMMGGATIVFLGAMFLGASLGLGGASGFNEGSVAPASHPLMRMHAPVAPR